MEVTAVGTAVKYVGMREASRGQVVVGTSEQGRTF
jgi:hypothetical protein